MLEQMLNLDGCIKGDFRELLMHGSNNAHGVCWPIEEIGIAEGDMTCSLCDLGTDICQHNFCWYGEETPMIDWGDGAVQAGMLAAASRFGITCKQRLAIQL